MQWIKENLIPCGSDNNNLDELISDKEIVEIFPNNSLSVALDKIEKVSDNVEINLPDCTVISRLQDCDLVRAMRVDLNAYDILYETISNKIDSLLESSNIHQLPEVNLRFKAESEVIEQNYIKQQVWKNISQSFCRGNVI